MVGPPSHLPLSSGRKSRFCIASGENEAASDRTSRAVDTLTNRSTSASDSPLLAATDLSTGYDGVPVVESLNLHVNAGEIVALLGANGAGKTTTLLALCGVLAPLRGTVQFLGVEAKGPLHQRSRLGLAFVPEDRSVIGALSVRDNLRLGPGAIETALDVFPDLKRLLNRRAGLLSGGEQQMLTLARALASRPKVLIADELSLGLAPLVVQRLLHALRDAATAQTGVLLVEQQVKTALAASDRAYVLRRGRLVMEGQSKDLLGRADEIEANYLGGVEVS
jgi:branched-chain amino acid transport system ATP-binding protein